MPVPGDSVTDVLNNRFGLESLRAGQKEVIDRLLAGTNTAAIFPTGGGKSLCYQLPALLLDGLTVVVSPLLALMKDQVDALKALGIEAVRLDSSQDPNAIKIAMEQLRSGTAKILYVAPERFSKERFRATLQQLRVSLFAVDEAHCISQWGHNFRPDYLRLPAFAREINAERVLALTATAPPDVAGEICSQFGIAHEDCIKTDFLRPNLHLRFTLTNSSIATATLIQKIKQRPAGATVVYASLRQTVERVAEDLRDAELDARPYHAGMDETQRSEIQNWFMTDSNPIIVATIAFGMGIDKPDIRYVYHFNPSQSLENYAQEIGRAGRDGKPSICHTLINPSDRIVLENFAYADTPEIQAIRQFVDFISNQPDRFFISTYALSRQFDIRESVVRTLMTYLELDQYIVGTGPRYDQYRFKLFVPLDQMVTSFQQSRQGFARDVLAMAINRKAWNSIDITKTCSRLNCQRSEVVEILETLAESGMMELTAKGLMYGYEFRSSITDVKKTAQQLSRSLMRREKSQIARIDKLYKLIFSERCQSAVLAKHFGQTRVRKCGKCSACLGNYITQPQNIQPQSLGDSVISVLANTVEQHPIALASKRDQAKFLCGISSPKLIAARLTRNDYFGCCAQISFGDVLNLLKGQSKI